MRNIVVTGASGFIGKALCQRLGTEKELRIIAADRKGLPAVPGAICVHLAGESDAAKVAGDFDRQLQDSLELARRLLGMGYARIVFASSALVYGDRRSRPHAESSPLEPNTAYGRLKKELETFFLKPPHAVARLSNVYGPGMSPNNVFSHILGQFRSGGGKVLMKNLNSVRDYLFISDAVQAIAGLALSDHCGPFNISTGRGATPAQLIELLSRLCGRSGLAVEARENPDPPSRLVLDPSRIEAALHWRAQVPLEQGLRALL
ncbi:MAG: NAD(P)-dependent oxidoreductase [Elusimicrobia bacterium]|nr:NAD(P)-dependent oxidoreductase [Elusimicrobiota bacterium]